MVTINEIQTQEGIPVSSGDVIIIDDDVHQDNKVYIAIRMENGNFMLYNPATYKYMMIYTVNENTVDFSIVMTRINSIYGSGKLKAHVEKRECVNYQLNITR